ncbi:mono/diheme cytochrome c family protein [Bradyrhizobium sp. USDA 372]
MQKDCPMLRHVRRVFLLLGLVSGVGTSSALGADADHGADLAKRWCASCHVVANGQTQASADVPSFASVARKPDFSAERLAFFLLDPHPKMPNFPLSRTEAGDIAAYIASLR